MTLVIIPATVTSMVIIIFSPDRYPPKGPEKNFSVVRRYTLIILAIFTLRKDYPRLYNRMGTQIY